MPAKVLASRRCLWSTQYDALQAELQHWAAGFNARYALLVESLLEDGLTLHQVLNCVTAGLFSPCCCSEGRAGCMGGGAGRSAL